jgi:hypothetical protein
MTIGEGFQRDYLKLMGVGISLPEFEAVSSQYADIP